MPQYPMLHFIGKFGGWCAGAAGVLPLLAAVWAVAAGFPAGWLAVGILAGVAVFVVARSYVELVRVMIDMLLPK